MMPDWRTAQRGLRTRLCVLRAQHGMTQLDVATHIGIHELAYGRLERGQRRIRRPEIVALAQLYGTSVPHLLDDSRHPSLPAPAEEYA